MSVHAIRVAMPIKSVRSIIDWMRHRSVSEMSDE